MMHCSTGARLTEVPILPRGGCNLVRDLNDAGVLLQEGSEILLIRDCGRGETIDQLLR